jgi:hypothetical protein
MQCIKLLTGPSRESVPKHDAIQVICLVLQAASQQACANHLDLFGVLVETAAYRGVRPR